MTGASVTEAHCSSSTADMIAPETALALAKKFKTGDLPITLSSLGGARGMILAADILACADVPPFDASAMDGYALTASDATNLDLDELRVSGQALAGDPPAALPRGEAIRVLTGAAIPTGADCVVLQEDVERLGDRIRL